MRALYMSGKKLHEVPFTMVVDGRFLRGTVDCLVQTASNRFTVLEFKTGQERSEHRAQIDLYQRAMQLVFPDCKVDTQLIYAGAPSAS
jgi:RecB family exonuclease